MDSPFDLSAYYKGILIELGFNFIESSDHGMWKHYLCENTEMQFSLTYDKGYYDCDIIPFKKPINRLTLIILLRFLKNDEGFYRDKLIKADLAYTLTVNEYVDLFFSNYILIRDFVSTFEQTNYNAYNNFPVIYNGI